MTCADFFWKNSKVEIDAYDIMSKKDPNIEKAE